MTSAACVSPPPSLHIFRLRLTEPNPLHLQEDYQNNVNARLQNPLYGLSREGLSKKVALFTAQSGLEEERELFEKAAILAQHPESFEEHESLTEDDKYHLRRETTHKWKQPFALCEFVLCGRAAERQSAR